MSKRAERRFNSYNKYKKRLKEWANFTTYGSNPPESWKDLKKRDWSKFLKDTPHPCSCPACSGERFDRSKQKDFDRNILNDQLKEWDDRHSDWDYWNWDNDLDKFYGKTG